jgi:hypothetical protein
MLAETALIFCTETLRRTFRVCGHTLTGKGGKPMPNKGAVTRPGQRSFNPVGPFPLAGECSSCEER